MKTELCNQLWDMIQELNDVDITLTGIKSYRITKNCKGGTRFPCGIRIVALNNQFPIKRTKYYQGEFMKYQFLGWCMTRLTIRDLLTLMSALECMNHDK
jgi:hypothetical protein